MIEKLKRELELAKGFIFDTTNIESKEIINSPPLNFVIPLGFARTPTISRSRFSPEQKAYMIFLFDKCAAENKKLNPQQGALLMAQHLEPLESTQIQSFWSRYHKKKKEKKKNTQTHTSPQVTELNTSSSQSIPVTSTNSSVDDLLNLSHQTSSSNNTEKQVKKCKTCKKPMKGHPRGKCN